MTDNFIQNIDFDERGLIAAIVQDAATREIVGLCYVDQERLSNDLRRGETTLLGAAGAPGGTWPLVDVRLNDDGKSLTVLVRREGVERVSTSRTRGVPPPPVSAPSAVALADIGAMEFGLTLRELYSLIAERKRTRPEGSYTTYLFNSGLDKILKKIAEESGEVIIAAKNDAAGELVAEMADVFYHLLVLMVERGVKLGDVGAELTRRAASRRPQPAER